MAVTETYDYNGLGGRVDARETAIQIDGGFTFRFDQGFVYDDLGNLSRIDYPSCTHAGCDAAEPARQVTYGFTNGWPTDVGIPGAGNANDYLGPLTYHPNGTWATRPHENGTLDHQVADPDAIRRPRRLYTEKERDATILFDTGNYEYDGAGNIRTMHAELGNPDFFRYDDRSRLVHGELGGWSEDYIYDDFGNLTQVTTTDPQSNITVRNIPADPSTNRTTVATYDGPGNIIAWSPPQGGNYAFHYDALDKLTKVDRGPFSSNIPTHVYSADDERVLVIRDPGIVDFPYPDEFYIRDLDGRLLRHLTREPGDPTQPGGGAGFDWAADYVHADRLIAKHYGSGATHHYHQDHLGSTRLITTDSAAVVSNHDYLPYGEEVTAAGTTQVLKFTGHERDRFWSIDLDYMHARFYSAHLARFLSSDPALPRLELRTPQAWNAYSYVVGDPLALLDPDGQRFSLALIPDEEQRKKLLTALSRKTGYSLGYKNGQVFIQGVIKSANGEMQGSATARRDIFQAVYGNKLVIGISANDSENINFAGAHGSNIYVDFADFMGINTEGNDPGTFDLGTVFLHEIAHSLLGLQDPSKLQRKLTPGLMGPAVRHVNQIRKELGLPLRLSYEARPIDGGFTLSFERGPVFLPVDPNPKDE